jgi:serine/threonine protein kinase
MLGEVIHGYRIDHALSADKGGFGDVYFATHVDSGAEAVVKVLKPEMSALRDIVARFFNEARAAASVHHPGIVQIHNVGYHVDRAYLLMERLRGDDLETRLAAGPLPVERAVVFVRQTAGAIGAAHDRGIVHRDLKPANLFVVADPDVVGGERVKVLDFGIAKLTVDSGAGKTQGVFGTPSYMSPEQCASTGAVDPRADLYSLGCIFYELVCGRPPFGHGGIELVAAHLRDTPQPPRALAPWLPPAIEQVILRLLEKQPDRRFASAAALIAALDEAVAASGLAGASAPYLPSAGSLAASAPRLPSGGPFAPSTPHPSTGGPFAPSTPHPSALGPFAPSTPHPSTLGSAAGVATAPAGRRGLGVWLGVGAMVVVGGAVAVVTVAGGGRGAPPPPAGSGDAGVAIAAPADAALRAAVTPDATQVAAVTPDAAVVATATPDAAPPSDAPAGPTQAELAERGNEQGKVLLRHDHPQEATRKFQEAIARDPQPTYFFNLCTAQFLAGQFDEALGSCSQVEPTGGTEELQARTAALVDRIMAEARNQHITVRPFRAVTPPPQVATDRSSDRSPRSTHDEPPPAPIVKSASKDEAWVAAEVAMAARLNDEGKALVRDSNYEEAARKFQQAIAHDGLAQYFFNLCVAQTSSGRLVEALTACRSVESHSPTKLQLQKAAQLIDKIKEIARTQNLELPAR